MGVVGSDEYLVMMKSIVKIYSDGTVALRGVDFTLRRGEVHGLLGENGAGKTTLMKILAGILKPTSGSIYVGGKKVSFSAAADALKLGIGMVHQNLSLIPTFTVYENIVLGLPGSRLRGAREDINKLMDSTGLRVPLDEYVERLPFGVRQKVEILKMLFRNVNILILDEPTTNLTLAETRELFNMINELRKIGRSVVFITHKLREVLEVADRVTVLRRGKVVGEVPREEANLNLLARLMVGKDLIPAIQRNSSGVGEELLIVRDLWILNDLGTWAVKGVSLTVRSGEIVGIAGVEGNGQKELVEGLTGLRKIEKGEVIFRGQRINNLPPSKLYELGIAHIPEDRVLMGLIPDFTVSENSILGIQRSTLFKRFFVVLAKERVVKHASDLVARFNVVVPSLFSPAKHLSGGNQQRLVVAREISKEPQLIIAAQPTRGLDISATEHIRCLLLDLKKSGKAVLLVSSDLEEILQLSDRVAVMYEGRFVGVKDVSELTEEKLGLMLGGVSV
ncbi:MAG: ABC transporter ATP-binding protein [Desulfurococcaceae archaeon TW002]